MGLGASTAKKLRHGIIGSPLVGNSATNPTLEWGPKANDLIDIVTRHQSKESSRYYRRFFTKYFDAVFQSLRSLTMVCRDEAPLALAVQNSSYKEILVDLASIYEEMLTRCGWRILCRTSYEIRPSFPGLNPKALAYAKAHQVREAVLVAANGHKGNN
jgi:hypothetical protein